LSPCVVFTTPKGCKDYKITLPENNPEGMI
jgi:hypothetical protein